MNIQDAAKEFYDYSLYFKGYSKKTIKRYRHAISYYIEIAKITALNEVTTDNIRAFFFFGRTERAWKTTSFLVYHKSLVVFFRWCREKGYMRNDYISSLEVPKVEYRLPTKLTKQEAFRILEVVYNYPYKHAFIRGRDHAIFSTFLFSGIRRSELLNLRYADVDIENLSLHVIQGKGAKDRIIPISATLAKSLKTYLEERKKLKKTCPEFFTSLRHNNGLSDVSLKRIVEEIKKASGVFFTVHKLRHTFATLMLEGGCDIYSLSRMLGHNDLKTTSIYLYASAEHLRSQMDKHPLDNS